MPEDQVIREIQHLREIMDLRFKYLEDLIKYRLDYIEKRLDRLEKKDS